MRSEVNRKSADKDKKQVGLSRATLESQIKVFLLVLVAESTKRRISGSRILRKEFESEEGSEEKLGF